ncbi:hypothetical protein [Microbacterium sp.]|uniref:hypothetical protein n=1 Tax=Microbacterium sp. TaxID=51671 RepID=UPI0037CC8986
MVVSIKFDADISNYAEEIQEAIKAIRDWETQTGVSSENATEKFEDAIRGVVKLGRATDRTRDDMKQALRGIGLSAGDAEDAIAAIERESGDLGRAAPRDMRRAEDAVKDLADTADTAGEKVEQIKDKTGNVGDGLRDLGSIAEDVLRGDFSSAASGAIDALGSIGGALTGGIVGGAIASGIAGIVRGWVTEWEEAAAKVEARIRSWAETFIEENGRVLDESVILDKAQEILTDDTGRLADAKAIAAASGADLAVVLRGLAGDSEALARVNNDLKATDEEYYGLMENLASRSYEVSGAEKERFEVLQRGREAQSQVIEEMDKGADVFDIFTRVVTAGKDETKEYYEAIDNLREGMLNLPANIKPKVDLDDSAARRKLNTLVHDINSTTARIKIGGSGSARQILGG